MSRVRARFPCRSVRPALMLDNRAARKKNKNPSGPQNMKYHYKITSGSVDDVPVIYVEGYLTSDADRDINEAYSEARNGHALNQIIINFDKTAYINSSGIAILIQIIQDVNMLGGRVAFVGMSDHLKKVMDIVGVSNFVSIHNTNSDVIKNV
jgi:anti-anti-sigma factor